MSVAAPAPAPVNPLADPWPRDVPLAGGAEALIYQPQVNRWEGNQLDWRVAVALTPSGAKTPVYGVVRGSARTDVDRGTRTVALRDLTVSQIRFPTLPDQGQSLATSLKPGLEEALHVMALDSLEAAWAASKTAQPRSLAVQNTPPKVIVSTGPAILVPVEGKPVFRAVAGTKLERLINTHAMIARVAGSPTIYLHVYDGWMSAPSLGGPWTVTQSLPAGLADLAAQLAKSETVDLLDGGPNATPKPSLSSGAPAIHVSDVPTELLVFKGPPNLVPITGTALLWASNTAADVIVDTNTSRTYVLMAGRWFWAPGLGGPWTYVSANALPPDFKRIPKGSPAAVVLASVAGTPQAQEAVIANSVPQTASVARSGGPNFAPVFDGAPQWVPISGTPLTYAINTPAPVIQVTPTSYYAVTGGVWFTSATPSGPWTVASSVPEVIYTIPTSSPIHYVTYVRVYGSSPTEVYVGYTPGYLGTVVSTDGVVVYGTGYAYSPWIGSVWYGAPTTYGLAAAPVYNAAVGWTFGFGMGLATAAWVDPYWGGAYYHPGYWGYPCCGSASANVYRNWGTGASSGVRSWYSGAYGVGTAGAGYYGNYRGTTGTYQFDRNYNAATGTFSQGYNRTFNTAAGTTGSVNRDSSYNPYTGQRSYGSNVQATGAGGSSVDRNVSASAGPRGTGYDATTTTYNAKTGQTKTWSNGVPQNDHVAGADGNVYRSDGAGGWQQHGAGGWGGAAGDTSWANAEQQARNDAAARSSSTFSSGWDRGGTGSSWGSRWGGDGGGWADRSGDYGDRFGGGGWGGRYGGGAYADRFGGGGGFGGFRGGGFRR